MAISAWGYFAHGADPALKRRAQLWWPTFPEVMLDHGRAAKPRVALLPDRWNTVNLTYGALSMAKKVLTAPDLML